MLRLDLRIQAILKKSREHSALSAKIFLQFTKFVFLLETFLCVSMRTVNSALHLFFGTLFIDAVGIQPITYIASHFIKHIPQQFLSGRRVSSLSIHLPLVFSPVNMFLLTKFTNVMLITLNNFTILIQHCQFLAVTTT